METEQATKCEGATKPPMAPMTARFGQRPKLVTSMQLIRELPLGLLDAYIQFSWTPANFVLSARQLLILVQY